MFSSRGLFNILVLSQPSDASTGYLVTLPSHLAPSCYGLIKKLGPIRGGRGLIIAYRYTINCNCKNQQSSFLISHFI